MNWGGCGGVWPLTFPKQCGRIVGSVEDGVLPHVKTVFHAVMMYQTSINLQVQVFYDPTWVLEVFEVFGNIWKKVGPSKHWVG